MTPQSPRRALSGPGPISRPAKQCSHLGKSGENMGQTRGMWVPDANGQCLSQRDLSCELPSSGEGKSGCAGPRTWGIAFLSNDEQAGFSVARELGTRNEDPSEYIRASARCPHRCARILQRRETHTWALSAAQFVQSAVEVFSAPSHPLSPFQQPC